MQSITLRLLLDGATGVTSAVAADPRPLSIEKYVPVLLMMAAGATVALGMFVATTFLGPTVPAPDKDMPFECGNPSDGARNLRPSVKFYLTALLFVVFDIEAVMIYPWAVKFRTLGWAGFFSMASFITVLAVVLIYVWRKGALEWEK